MAQLLNNKIVWMVLYCERQLFGSEKTKPFLYLSLGKAGLFTFESHIRVKALNARFPKSLESLLNPY